MHKLREKRKRERGGGKEAPIRCDVGVRQCHSQRQRHRRLRGVGWQVTLALALPLPLALPLALALALAIEARQVHSLRRQLLQKRPPSGVDWNFKRSRPDKLPPSAAASPRFQQHLLLLRSVPHPTPTHLSLLSHSSLALSFLVSSTALHSFSLCWSFFVLSGGIWKDTEKCYLVYYNDAKLLYADIVYSKERYYHDNHLTMSLTRTVYDRYQVLSFSYEYHI